MMNRLNTLPIFTGILFFCFSNICNAQFSDKQILNNRNYDGLYIGASIGAQNIFGGAFIDDLDIIAQKSGLALDVSVGIRQQILNDRIVVGAEFLYGFTDGDLQEIDVRNDINIDYLNSQQLGVGINLGYAFGPERNILVSVMLQQARRNFDISFLNLDGESANQDDRQNFDRYGVMVEFPLLNKISLKANVSQVSVDFGDVEVSQDLKNQFDFNVGVIFTLVTL
ncbi:MAG: outer membrane beta-barrel protein [Bacteroidota bacterium]